jgi:hypothetical protein
MEEADRYIAYHDHRAVQWHSVDTVCNEHSVEVSGEGLPVLISELPVHSHENGVFARSAQCQ